MRKTITPLSLGILVCLTLIASVHDAIAQPAKAQDPTIPPSASNCVQPPIIHCPPPFNACPGTLLDPDVTGWAKARAAQPECPKPVLSYSERTLQTGTCAGSLLLQRIWTAADPADPSLRSFCIQYVSSLDTLAPHFSHCPRDTVILSNEHCVGVFRWEMPCLSDGCGNFELHSSHPNGGEFSIGHHLILLTATDECGNTASCQFKLEVLENCCQHPPRLSCPPDFTGCPSQSTDPSETGFAIATKSSPTCNDPILSHHDSIVHTNVCTYAILRTWTATDPDNPELHTSCTQHIVLEDHTPPTITYCPPSVTVSSDEHCEAVIEWDDPLAVDACGTANVTTSLPKDFKFQLGVTGVVVIATDACGNTSKCEFVITVTENCCRQAPAIQCPSDYTTCPGASLDPAFAGRPTVHPGGPHCPPPLVSSADLVRDSSACSRSITRIWTATDPVNPALTAHCSQQLRAEDHQPPIISYCPPNVTVQSDENCEAVINWSDPVASDGCGDVQVTTSLPRDFKFQIGVTGVVVIATDACGNTSKCEFVITVTENCCRENPEILCPADYTDCPGASLDPSVTGTPQVNTASPSCPNAVLEYRDDTIALEPCRLQIARTWTAYIPGKEHLRASCVQQLHYEDEDEPYFTFCPPDQHVASDPDCQASVSWRAPIAKDACGGVTLLSSHASGARFPLGSTSVQVVATDACGNTSSCAFQVTVANNCCQHPPSLVCPADFTGCPGTSSDPSVTGTATALPGGAHCGQPLLSYRDSILTQSTCNTEWIRIWEARDPIFPELAARCEQRIRFADRQAPVITYCPPSRIIASGPNCEIVVGWDDPQATDACGDVQISTSLPKDFSFKLGITGVVVIATDACGNTSKCEFVIDVLENCCNDAPVITCPPHYQDCPGADIDPALTGSATAKPYHKACSPAVISYTDVLTLTHLCDLSIDRIWKATNPKNNAASQCIQNIRLVDTTAPEFLSCPGDITVDPGYDCRIPVYWNVPEARDFCSTVSLVSSHAPGSVFETGDTRIVYTASDACSNTNNCSFVVRVSDKCCNAAPVLSCPPAFRACPGSDISPASAGLPTATAGRTECDDPVLSYADRVLTSGPCHGAVVLERSWTAQDPWRPELQSSCIQEIELKDDQPPVLTGMPEDRVIDARGACEVNVTWDLPNATDNCGLRYLDPNFPPSSSFGAGVRWVVYTATDNCDNITRDSFRIEVTGTEIAIDCPRDTVIPRQNPFVNGAFFDWDEPIAKHCEPCIDSIPGFIYMGKLNGKRYFCSLGPANWTAARIRCEQLGGNLAVVETAEENRFLSTLLNGQTAWIGATDEKIEGHFEWIDGQPVIFSNWLPGQPNNSGGDEDHVELLPDGGWNDRNGATQREFICEIPCYELIQTSGVAKGELLPCGENVIRYIARKNGEADTCQFTVTVDCNAQTTYCQTAAVNSEYMHIQRVRFAGIDQTSGNDSGYRYFSDPCGAIEASHTYSICLQPGYASIPYQVYWKVWIDYNADGFFDPLTEEVVYGYGNAEMCAQITMPAYLPKAITRMRVIQSFTAYPPNPCTAPLFGEVEDYCLLSNGGPGMGANDPSGQFRKMGTAVPLHAADVRMPDLLVSSFEVLVFPNPADAVVHFRAVQSFELELFDAQGKLTFKTDPGDPLSEHTLNVSSWKPGLYTGLARTPGGQTRVCRMLVNP